MRIYRVIFLFWFLLLSLVNSAQQVSNIHFEQVGKQIHIYYDLQGDQAYTVQVFCSTDNGQTWGNPLQKVTGEVGESQIPGNTKMIVWDVLAEREKLTGEAQFKIEAQSTIQTGTFTDARDSQTYKWVKIGSQVWMAENLNYKANSGSWVYNNDSKNAATYGQLYDWSTARRACPSGWHLPTDEEWEILVNYLGRNVAAGKMKETGTTHWLSPNAGATNESSFSALSGGYRDASGAFYGLGYRAYWWSATERSSASAWSHHLRYHGDGVRRNGSNKGRGFSVRCLRD